MPPLPRAPASAPPVVPIVPTLAISNVQKRVADVLVLQSSPKKNFENKPSLVSEGYTMQDDNDADAMEVDTDFQHHRNNPPMKMRRTSSVSSFEEDEMAYVLPSPTDVIPVGFSMASGILPCIETGKDAFRRISPGTVRIARLLCRIKELPWLSSSGP